MPVALEQDFQVLDGFAEAAVGPAQPAETEAQAAEGFLGHGDAEARGGDDELVAPVRGRLVLVLAGLFQEADFLLAVGRGAVAVVVGGEEFLALLLDVRGLRVVVGFAVAAVAWLQVPAQTAFDAGHLGDFAGDGEADGALGPFGAGDVGLGVFVGGETAVDEAAG